MARKKTIKEIESEIKTSRELARFGKLEKKTVLISCGAGLYVTVNNNTASTSWVARIAGKMTRLGDVERMQYKTARAEVDKLKQSSQKELKSDPEKTSPTLGEIWPEYIELKSARLKKGSNRPSNLRALYKNVLAPLQTVPLHKITRVLTIKTVRELDTTEGNKYNGVSLLTMILDYACNNGIIDHNPLKGMLRGCENPFPRPQKKHHTALTADEFIQKVMLPLEKSDGFYRAYYLLLALTGLRFDECRLLRWSWIDTRDKVIRIAPDAQGANKTKHELIKPLTIQMMELLGYLKAVNVIQSDFIFQSPFNDQASAVSENKIREFYRVSVGKVQDPHGFRTTVKTWVESQRVLDPATGIERKTYDAEICEAVLTHDVRTALQKTYDLRNFIEPVRNALQAWNDFLISKLPGGYAELLNIGREYLKNHTIF